MEKEIIVGKFQWGENFGFVIPDDREYYGWDFYVAKKDFKGAKDGDRVEARELIKAKWKKPEAKILQVLWKKKTPSKNIDKKIIEGVYASWDGNFGFVDIVWQEKGYFCYWDKKNGAKDGDKVRAEIVEFRWKQEAVVMEVLNADDELIDGIFKDNDRFAFVLPFDESGDIFIAGHRKSGAREWDRVGVKIIGDTGKNREGMVRKIY